MTKKEACIKWVDQFNAIPMALIEKAYRDFDGSMQEITPFHKGATVFVCVGAYAGETGYIKYINKNQDKGRVHLDSNREVVTIALDDVELQQEDGWLPIWGTMWAFNSSCDDHWLENNLTLMAECGFRIYESDELGYFFGIDGAGYDFYEAHWMPLYEARGLLWHTV